MFGQSTPAFGSQTSGLFGQQNRPTFGAATAVPATPFGTPQAATTLFGASTASGASAFSGGTAAAGGLFGSSTTQNRGTGLFGGTTQSSGSGFGTLSATSFQGTSAPISGTTTPFAPPEATDSMVKNGTQQTINTKTQCITAMQQYHGKCLEELRVDDYLANRKTGTAGQNAVGAGGLFGATAAQPQTVGMFGGTTAQPQASGLFGAAKPAGTGLFGSGAASTAQSSGLFGATTTTQAGGLFGAQQKSGLFASTSTAAAPAFGASTFGQPHQATSLFGPAQPAFGSTPAAPFGQTATSTAGGLFGSSTFGQQQQQATGGLFGAAKPATGLFGQPAVSTAATPAFAGFGTQQAATPFGAPTQGTGLFGARPAAPAFGQTSTSTAGGLFGQQAQQRPLFGSTAAQPGGLFGQPTAQAPAFGQAVGSTGLFGTQPGTSLFPAASQASTGLFGSTPAAPGGLFSQPPPQIGQAPQVASLAVAGSVDSSAIQIQNQYFQEQIRSLRDSPYGDSIIFKKVMPLCDKASKDDISPALRPLSQRHQQLALQPAAPILNSNLLLKDRPSPRATTKAKSLFSDMRDCSVRESVGSPDGFLPKKTNIKKLVIKKKNDSTVSDASFSNGYLPPPDSMAHFDRIDNERHVDTAPSFLQSVDTLVRLPGANVIDNEPRRRLNLSDTRDLTTCMVENTHVTEDRARTTSPLRSSDRLNDSATQTFNEPVEDDACPEPHPAGIVLTMAGYYTNPSLEHLRAATNREGQCVLIDGFAVGRRGYGSVYWPGEINVSGLNLDDLVEIRHKEVTVYPDDDRKPAVGLGLNREAVITLDRVWPLDKSTHEHITSPERLSLLHYEDRLRKSCDRMETDFISYQGKTGTWKFKVKHFSKYGLLEEDEELPVVTEVLPQPHPQNIHAMHVGLEGRAVTHAPSHPNNLWLAPRVVPDIPADSRVLMDESTLEDQAEMDFLPQSDEDDDMPSNEEYDALPNVSLDESRHQALQSSLFGATKRTKMTKSAVSFHDDATMVPTASKSFLSTVGTDFAPSFQTTATLDRTRSATTNIRTLLKQSALAAQRAQLALPLEKTKLQPRVWSESLLSDTRNSCDAGLFNGRRFRGVVHRVAKSQNVFFDTIDIFDPKSAYPEYHQQYLTRLLDIHHAASQSTTCMVTCAPHFSPDPAKAQAALQRYVRLTEEDAGEATTYHRSVWSLCSVLWGDMEGDISPYMEEKWRMTQLAHFWTDFVSDSVDKALSVSENNLDSIFIMLTGGRVADAVQLALTSKRTRLAMLIGACGAIRGRAMVMQQLLQWREVQADMHINRAYIKIMCLLGGFKRWVLSDGTFVCVVEGLPWERAFGLCLWHQMTDGDTKKSIIFIKDVVERYEDALEKELVPQPRFDADGRGLANDIHYELLRVYSGATQSLAGVIDTLSHSENAYDFSLSWHVYGFLRSIGYVAHNFEAQLMASFAAQLTSAGLAEWAAYVFTHLADGATAERMIRELLDRTALSLNSNKEIFLTETIGIPLHWLGASKALGTPLSSSPELHYKHAIGGRLFNHAHDVLMRHLTARCVARGTYDDLQSHVNALKNHSDDVHAWSLGAGILDHFLDLKVEMEQNEEHLDRALVRKHVVELIKSLSTLELATPRQRMVAATLSNYVVEWLQVLDRGVEGLADDRVRLIAQLPLRPDDLADLIPSTASDMLKLLQKKRVR